MGKQGDIKLRCTVGNIIYYQWRGIHCERTVPARVRQTKPTKKAATDFGKAVKCSAIVRSLFSELAPLKTGDRSLIYKMDGAFRKWLKGNPLDDNQPIDGIASFDNFSFNESNDIKRVIGLKVVTSRTAADGLLVQWPAYNPVNEIKAPTGTSWVLVKYLVATIDMDKLAAQQFAETSFTIPYTDEMMPAQNIQFDDVTGPRCIVLLGMSLRYYKDELLHNPINTARWKLGGIVESFFN